MVDNYKNLPKSAIIDEAYRIWQEYFENEILNVDPQSKYVCKKDLLNSHTWTFDVITVSIFRTFSLCKINK